MLQWRTSYGKQCNNKVTQAPEYVFKKQKTSQIQQQQIEAGNTNNGTITGRANAAITCKIKSISKYTIHR